MGISEKTVAALGLYEAALVPSMRSLLVEDPSLGELRSALRALGRECLRFRLAKELVIDRSALSRLSASQAAVLDRLGDDAAVSARREATTEFLFASGNVAFLAAVERFSKLSAEASVPAEPTEASARSSGELAFVDWIERKDLKSSPETIFVFGDNFARSGLGGQAAAMRGERNAVGIPTKRAPSWDESAFFDEGDLSRARAELALVEKRLREHLAAGGKVVWPSAGIGTDRARLASRLPAFAADLDAFLVSLAADFGARVPSSALILGRSSQASRSEPPTVAPASGMQVLNKREGTLPNGAIDVSRHGTLTFPGDRLPSLRNPYVMSEYGGNGGSRRDVVVSFARDLSIRLKDEAFAAWFGKNVVGAPAIGCYCAPELCHGHVIKAAADAMAAGLDPAAAVAAWISDPEGMLSSSGASFVSSNAGNIAFKDAAASWDARVRAAMDPPRKLSEFAYAGVGSRETPEKILVRMRAVGELLGRDGFVCRSGGAVGADSAFEEGSDAAGGKKRIFIAWRKLSEERMARNVPGAASDVVGIDSEDERIAREVLRSLGKNYDNYSRGAASLQARNVRQILGERKDCPAVAVVAWTRDGKMLGGTATALRLAEMRGVPIINLGSERWRDATPEEIAGEVVRLRDLEFGRGDAAPVATPGAPKGSDSAPFAPDGTSLHPAILAEGAGWIGSDRDVLSFAGNAKGDRRGSNMYATRLLWGDEVSPVRPYDAVEVPYVLAKTLDSATRDRLLRTYEAVKARALLGGSSAEDAVEAGCKALKTSAKGLEDGPLGRPDWKEARLPLMRRLVSAKFKGDADCARWLLGTGRGLIQEGNYWGDAFWGVATRDVPSRGVVAGQGANHLGRIMMEVRCELVAELSSERSVGSVGSVVRDSTSMQAREAERRPVPKARGWTR